MRHIQSPQSSPRFQYFKLKSATFSLLYRAIFAKVDPQTGGPGGWPQGAGIVLLRGPPYANLRIFVECHLTRSFSIFGAICCASEVLMSIDLGALRKILTLEIGEGRENVTPTKSLSSKHSTQSKEYIEGGFIGYSRRGGLFTPPILQPVQCMLLSTQSKE